MARHHRPRVDVVVAAVYAVWALFIVVAVVYVVAQLFS
jgi:hypothetical protein